jgi:multiple sugar transport system permease protein
VHVRTEARAGALLVTPALIVIGVFFLLPAAASFVLSLTDFDIYAVADIRNLRFIGFANYAQIFSDPIFWRAMRNTLYYAVIGGPLTVAVALAAALLLNSKAARFKGLFRTIYFAPVVTTLVAVAVVFRFFYHPRIGVLNRVLAWFGIPGLDWLGDARFALPAIILLAIWKNFGYSMIIFIAGLQSIPEELYEAAKIDGARVWQQFRHITVPMLQPTFLFVGVITAIGYMQLFAEPYVMTPTGGPLKSTVSIVMLMYEQGFRWWNLGLAAAIAFALFIVIGVGTLIQVRAQRARAGVAGVVRQGLEISGEQ